MNVHHYTPVHFSKKSFQFTQFFSSHFEPLLLSLLVLTGFIGSVYLFGQDINGNESAQYSPLKNNPESASLSGIFLADETDDSSNDFKDYVDLDGKIEAGKTFYFEFLKDEKASRYVMEMGDGVRLIVTQKNLQYLYTSPGKYVIELKEIKGGLLHLIGTRKVKVK